MWKYGKIGNGVQARKSRLTGKVYVLVWLAGQHGHKKNWYHQCGIGWEKTFVQDAH